MTKSLRKLISIALGVAIGNDISTIWFLIYRLLRPEPTGPSMLAQVASVIAAFAITVVLFAALKSVRKGEGDEAQ